MRKDILKILKSLVKYIKKNKIKKITCEVTKILKTICIMK